jgi:hypothetical protein
MSTLLFLFLLKGGRIIIHMYVHDIIIVVVVVVDVSFTPYVAKQVSDELWTKALKMMLTDVKWIVAWAAKHVASSV